MLSRHRHRDISGVITADGTATRARQVAVGSAASARDAVDAVGPFGAFLIRPNLAGAVEDMRAQAAQAQRMPSFEAPFRNLYLNQRIDAKSPRIPRAEWVACQAEGPLLRLGETVYLGLDLSATTDLTALVAVSAEDGERVTAWFWKPGDLLKQHADRDRAPYVDWQQAGWIQAPPGRAVDYGFVARRIAEIAADYEVQALAYDRWRIEALLRELAAIGVDAFVDGKDDARTGALRLVPWGQGWRDMAPAIDALEISVLERRFQHPGNPVLTFCFVNAVSITDASGNRKLDKSATRFRIDGAVAAAMAIGCKARDRTETEDEPSIYEVMAQAAAAEAAAREANSTNVMEVHSEG